MTHRSNRLAGHLAAGLLACLIPALTACGADDSSGGGSGGTGGSGDADGVPAACADAYPFAVGSADLADVTLRPADFPEPPVAATLCQTSSTLDDTLTTADYATDATATEVLDAYEAQLADREPVRVDQGAGETLTGDLGEGLFVQVTPGEGRYSVAFGTE